VSISEHFRYRNDVFQSDIFVSDIGITDVDVGCRISPTLRSMSMPTYDSIQVLPFRPNYFYPFSSGVPPVPSMLHVRDAVIYNCLVLSASE
jgi:hypothetical protein